MSADPERKSVQALQHGCALCILLIAALLFYAPPSGWQQGYCFGRGFDPWIYIWFLHWWPFAIQHHLPLFYTGYVDAPVGESLAWKTGIPSLSLLTLPLAVRFGPVAVYDGLMIAAPGLAGWGTYLLAYQLTRRFRPSLCAGFMFGFSNYELSQLLGHLNLAFVAAVPASVWICLVASRNAWHPARLAAILGALFAFQFGVSQEIFADGILFGALLLTLLCLSSLPARTAVARLAPGIAGAIGVCVLLTAPFLWQMLRWYGRAATAVSSPATVASDMLGFVVPTRLTWIGGTWFSAISRHFPGEVGEQGCYVGLPLLVLLIRIVRDGRGSAPSVVVGWMALLAAMLSLGPYVHVLGVAVSTAPWIAVHRLPFLKSMLPGRFILFGWLSVAMLVALWLAAPEATLRRYCLLACCLLFVLPDHGFARRWTPIRIPDVLAATTGQSPIPRGSRILVLPEIGEAVGYQVMNGMGFSLVGQGYLGNGWPRPFDRWRLYPSLFNSDFAHLDAVEFAAYLATYRVDRVVVLQDGFIRQALGAAVHTDAVVALLRDAGWQRQATTVDAIVFAPGPDSMRSPTPAMLTSFMDASSPQRLAKRRRSETEWVCTIRRLARTVHLDGAPALAIYAERADPPVPVAQLGCVR